MLDDWGAVVLTLTLDGCKDAVDRRLQTDHLALHDLDVGPVSGRPAMRQRMGETYQVLALEAGETPVGGERWWMVHEQGSDMAVGEWLRGREKGAHSTEAEDNAWTFFFSGFSNTHCAPLSWQRRQGAWQRAARAGRMGGQTGRGQGHGGRG